tara:strand:- start:2237 stop:3118 length:882 start_codon:yes stop_codon:yes gene_type:complete
MELHQLKSFITIAEEKNLTRAAERLFTSQPAVSAHIKSLEEELGLSLFDRTSRGMILTLDGEKMLEKAQHTLNSITEINHLARDLQANPSGTLKVGVILDADDIKLELISESLYQTHPGIQLEFIHSSSGTISEGLLNGDLDVGFFEGIVETPLLTGIKVGKTNLIIIGSPKFQNDFQSSDWKAIEQLPWVFKTPQCSYYKLMERISKANDLSLNRRYVIDHEGTCLQFARNGSALSVVNANVVEKELAQGSLIAWKGFHEALDIHLLCTSKRSQERTITAFFQTTKTILNLD